MKKFYSLFLAVLLFILLPTSAFGAFSEGDGKESNPYIIETPEQLDAVHDDLDAHYKLDGDIDLYDYLSGSEGGWLPIGDDTNPFTGSFDGGGHKINGNSLTIYLFDTDNVGLFGVTNGASIKNLVIGGEFDECLIVGASNVGILTGKQIGGSIENCFVIGGAQGNSNVGGLVGYQQGGSIINSYARNYGASDLGIYGNESVGGLIGYQQDGGIENCYAYGSPFGDFRVGGLVGTQSGGIIKNSYSSSFIYSSINGYNEVGGLVGRQTDGGFIENCYATGSVNGMNVIGGLVGYQQTGSIERCYSITDVQCDTYVDDIEEYYVGGLVGHQETGGSIANSYRYQSVSVMIGYEEPVSMTDDPDGVHGDIVTAAQLTEKVTYTSNGWQFNDSVPVAGSWHWDDIGFPKLNMGTENFPFNFDEILIINPLDLWFGYLPTGYAQPDAQTVTITGLGFEPITLDQPTAVNYDIGELSTTELSAAGGTATFTVQPKAGLAAGAYNETINITGGNGARASIPVMFTVRSRQSELSITGGSITKIFGAADFAIETSGGSGSGGLRWSSSSASVATVDYNGLVHINGAGQTTISVYKEEDTDYDKSNTATIILNVTKADTAFPTIQAINAVYMEGLTLSNLTLPSGYVWDAPETLLNAGSGQNFPATFTNPNGNYNPIEGNVTVNVTEATGVFPDIPEINATRTAGLTLGNLPLPAGYVWDAPETLLNVGGGQSFMVTYTDPSGNYNPVKGAVTVNLAPIRVTLTAEQTDGGDGIADTRTLRVTFTRADGNGLPGLPRVNDLSLRIADDSAAGIRLDSVTPVDGNPNQYLVSVSYPPSGSLPNGSKVNLSVADWSARNESGEWDFFTADNSPELTIYKDTRTPVNFSVSAFNNVVENNYPISTYSVAVSFDVPVPRSLAEMLTFTNVTLGGWRNISDDENPSAEWRADVTDVQTDEKTGALSTWNLVIPPDNRQFKTTATARAVNVYKDTRVGVSFTLTGSGASGVEDSDRIIFTFSGFSDGIKSLKPGWNLKVGQITYGGYQITQFLEKVTEGQVYELSLQRAGIPFENGDTLTVDLSGGIDARYYTIGDPVKSVTLWKKPKVPGVMRLDSVAPATAHLNSLNALSLIGLLKTDSASVYQVIFRDSAGNTETVSVAIEDQGNADFLPVNVQGVRMLKQAGNYEVAFRATDGFVSEYRPLTILDNPSLSQSGYGILAVTQGSGGAIALKPCNSESELKSAGNALITFRGSITKADDGSFQVGAGSTLNKALMYVGGAFDTLKVSQTGGKVTVTTNNGGYISWNGIPITPLRTAPPIIPGFIIELDSSKIYRTERNGAGNTEMEIRSYMTELDVKVFGVEATTDSIKLYRDAVSVGGSVKLGKTLEFMNLSEASLTLNEMVLGNKTGIPPMNAEGEVELDIGKALKLGDVKFSGKAGFKLNNIDSPGEFGISGEMELSKVLFVEGEFLMKWGDLNGKTIVVPDTIYFFARSDMVGVPLVPPTVIAYLTGFGGGMEGLGDTILGEYPQIPPIKIKLSVAMKDALSVPPGSILDIKKATLTIGPSEFSVYANEATLMKFVKLTDVGYGFGLIDPAKPGKWTPDVYYKAEGKASMFNGVLKGGVDVYLQVHVNQLDGTLKDLFKNNSVSLPNADTVKKMLNAVDFTGKANLEAGMETPIGSIKGGLGAEVNMKSISGTVKGSLSGGYWFFGWHKWTISAALNAAYYWGKRLEIDLWGNKFSFGSRAMRANNFDDARSRRGPITLTVSKPKALRAAAADNVADEQEQLLLTNVYSLGMYRPGEGARLSSRAFGALSVENRIEIPDMASGDIAALYSTAQPELIRVFHDGVELESIAAQWFDGVAGVPGHEGETLYVTRFVAAANGTWAFEADGLLDSMHVRIHPLPTFDYVTATLQNDGKLDIDWSHDDADMDADLRVKLLLMNADTDDIVSSVIEPKPVSEDIHRGYPEAGIGEFEAVMPPSLPSGRYYVSARLFHTAEAISEEGEPEQMEINLDMADSEVFVYENPIAPGTPSNLRTEYAGNGSFTVKWDAVPDADGYTVSILSESGAPLDGIGHIDVSSSDITETTISGGFTTFDPNDPEFTAQTSGLEYGKFYQISVQAYRIKISGEGEETAEIPVFGQAATENYSIPTPEIPLLSITADGGHETEALVAVNSRDVSFTVTSSVNTDINVYLDNDETPIASGSGTELTFTRSFEDDGMYSLRVEAVNGLDSGNAGMNLIVDTVAPFLNVDNDSFTARDGKVTVSGFAEQGAALTVDGEPLEESSDGTPIDGEFTFERAADGIVNTVQITASDLAGNTSARVLTILPYAASTMTASSLEPFASLEVGYQQPAAQTVTLTNGGVNDITLTRPTAVNFEIGALSTEIISASGGTATFTVRPNAGLPVGTYEETITITGSDEASASVVARFTVTESNNKVGIAGGEFSLSANSSGTGWNWNAGNKTLTLTGGDTNLGDITFVTGDNLTIDLTGDNITALSVTNTGGGDIRITSAQGKSLTLNAPAGTALSAVGDIVIDSGNVYASTLDESADAISAGGSVLISGTANVSAEITNGSGAAISAAENINISTDGNVTVNADAGFGLKAAAINITGGKTEIIFDEEKGGSAYNVTPAISGDDTIVTVNGVQIYPKIAQTTLKASFQSRPATGAANIETLLFKWIRENAVIAEDTVTTDENGEARILVPSPNNGLSVWVKGERSLSVLRQVGAVANGDVVDVGVLPGGDSNGDNVVNLIDFGIFARNFNRRSTDPAFNKLADYNNDGGVNLIDFGLFARNFNKRGESLPAESSASLGTISLTDTESNAVTSAAGEEEADNSSGCNTATFAVFALLIIPPLLKNRR